MKTDYKFTRKEFIDGKLDNQYASTSFIFVKIGSVYILPFAAMYYSLKLLNITSIPISLISYISIILLSGILYKNNKTIILKRIKNDKSEQVEVTWELSEDGLHMVQNKINVSLVWNSITKIVEKPNYIHIYNNRNIPVFIPIKSFKTDDELNSFKGILKAHIDLKLYRIKK